MQFDVAALPAEDLEPLTKALSLAPPEKRGEVYMRIQNAGREFLAKATAGNPPSVEAQTDPIKRAVFGALTKQLPAPPPQLDPLKREALGSLEKAVMAGIRGAARGVGDALGVTGRAGGMRQMRGAYRSSMAGAKDLAEGEARFARKGGASDGPRWMDGPGMRAPSAKRSDGPRWMDDPSSGPMMRVKESAKRYGRSNIPNTQAGTLAYKDSMAVSRRAARGSAAKAGQNFRMRGNRTADKAGAAGIIGASAAAGAAGYAATRPRQKQDQ